VTNSHPHRDAVLLEALKVIAAGRAINGMPLPREIARQMARDALISIGERWPLHRPPESDRHTGGQ
jgi:hypothetical protein